MLVASFGAAENAIIFLFAYVALILVSIILFAYSSHCLLVVIEQSAVGSDEVTWPDEPYFDWIWRGAAIAWLLLVWLAPLGVVLKIAYRDIYTEAPGLAVLFGSVTLWFFFPIGILSSLLAGSRWAFLHPLAFRALTLRPSATQGFYAASLALLAAVNILWFAAFTVSGLLIPVAGLVGAAAMLVYARLIGRLLWIVSPPAGNKRKRKKRPTKDECEALPPLIVPQSLARPAEAGDGYDVVNHESPQSITSAEDEEYDNVRDSYGLAADPDEQEKKEKELVRDLLAPVHQKVARAEGQLIITHAPRSLWGGVYSFPLYEKTANAWILLAALGTVVGGILKVLLGSGPTG